MDTAAQELGLDQRHFTQVTDSGHENDNQRITVPELNVMTRGRHQIVAHQ